MNVKETQYGGKRELFLYNHKVESPFDFVPTASYVTTLDDGRKMVKAGTIVPANDATAKGIVQDDYYFDRDENGSIAIHGFVKVDAMPEAPTDAAKAALPMIHFEGAGIVA